MLMCVCVWSTDWLAHLAKVRPIQRVALVFRVPENCVLSKLKQINRYECKSHYVPPTAFRLLAPNNL